MCKAIAVQALCLGTRFNASGANYLLRVRTTGLYSQKQIINDGFAHFTQVMRGKRKISRHKKAPTNCLTTL